MDVKRKLGGKEEDQVVRLRCEKEHRGLGWKKKDEDMTGQRYQANELCGGGGEWEDEGENI